MRQRKARGTQWLIRPGKSTSPVDNFPLTAHHDSRHHGSLDDTRSVEIRSYSSRHVALAPTSACGSSRPGVASADGAATLEYVVAHSMFADGERSFLTTSPIPPRHSIAARRCVGVQGTALRPSAQGAVRGRFETGVARDLGGPALPISLRICLTPLVAPLETDTFSPSSPTASHRLPDPGDEGHCERPDLFLRSTSAGNTQVCAPSSRPLAKAGTYIGVRKNSTGAHAGQVISPTGSPLTNRATTGRMVRSTAYTMLRRSPPPSA